MILVKKNSTGKKPRDQKDERTTNTFKTAARKENLRRLTKMKRKVRLQTGKVGNKKGHSEKREIWYSFRDGKKPGKKNSL